MSKGADSVSIPMTKKDDKGNVMEYRITPLAFDDKRFETIRGQIGHELRTKFMKLYKKTKDAGARTPAVEMSAFLAAFVFEQLVGWYGVLVEITNDPKMAAMNTFHIFGETFKHLTGELAEVPSGSETGTEDTSGNQEADEEGSDDDSARPDKSEEDADSDRPAGGEDEGRQADDGGEGGEIDPEDAEKGEIPLPPGGDSLDSDS